MIINENQAKIYNAYLKSLADHAGRPYRERQNFDKIDKGKLAALDKLERFFERYPHIQPYNFFKASFDECGVDFIKLEDFTKYKAVTIYGRKVRDMYESSADSKESIESFKSGIVFINDFTRRNGLSFGDYPNTVNKMGVPYYILHMKEQRISFYHLHIFDVELGSIPEDYRELIMTGFDVNYHKTKRNYLSSTTMKSIGDKVREKFLEHS